MKLPGIAVTALAISALVGGTAVAQVTMQPIPNPAGKSAPTGGGHHWRHHKGKGHWRHHHHHHHMHMHMHHHHWHHHMHHMKSAAPAAAAPAPAPASPQ